MKKFLLFCLSCSLLFAEELKEYECLIPFEAEMSFKDEDGEESGQVVGALLRLKSGEVLVAGNSRDVGFELENPFYLSESEDEEGCSLRSVDGREIGDGFQIATTGQKIVRTVVAMEGDRVVFDDGYVIFQGDAAGLPNHVALELEDFSCTLDTFSVHPIVLKGEIVSEEFSGTLGLDFTYGASILVQMNGPKGERMDFRFRAGDEFKTAIGCGDYRVGEVYHFYPLTDLKGPFEMFIDQGIVLEEDSFLIYRAN